MLGSFLGFTIGGVGAAMEVNRHMQDPKRKMQVFQQIAMEARQKAMEKAAEASGVSLPSGGGPSPTSAMGVERTIPRSYPGARTQGDNSGSSVGNVGREAMWGEDEGSRREIAEELEREKEYSSEVKILDRDGRFASDLDNRVDMPSGSQASGQNGKPSASGAGAGAGAWDRLRTKAFPSQAKGPAQEQNNGVPAKRGRGGEDERTKEQREFDEMLERERQGVPENETWK